MDVKGTRILVVGLARSGFAVARALAARGAKVTVTDLKPPSMFRDLLPQLLKDKIGLELGSQRQETFLHQDAIVISPGVPWDLAQLQAARKVKIPIYPEVEVATWFLEGTLIGVTGSNGKTTTTSLMGDMLRAAGFPTFVGGNIGNALSLAIGNTEPGTFFVTELSSFQLEGIQEFRPHVAVMLNLSPNHLDRHPSLDAYAQAKRRIFRNQQNEDFAILNADDPWVASLRTSVASRPLVFSRQRELPHGVFASEGKVYYRVRHLERVLFETREVNLRGAFNLENVLAAAAAACALGADFAAIRKAVREFQAVEHRLEFVREIQGVDFYNNSKATSVDATLKSLEAFERDVHLILGGKDKGAPYTPLLPLIRERVNDVHLIGAAAPIIARDLAGSVELVPCGDLATAVREAFHRARPGDTVLLAPACSSFDQFKDYEERGHVFKDLVAKLAGEGPAAARAYKMDRGEEFTQPLPRSQVVVEPSETPVEGERAAERVPSPPPADQPPATSVSRRATPPVPLPEVESPSPSGAGNVEPVEPPAGPTMPSPSRDQAGEGGTPLSVASEPEAEKVMGLPEEVPVEDAVASPSPAPDGGVDRGLPHAEDVVSKLATPRRGELTYVYEIDVQEIPPAESQLVAEEALEAPLPDHEAEVASDEPLPFEVRAEKVSEASKGSARRRGRMPKNRSKSGGDAPSPQSRLPGID